MSEYDDCVFVTISIFGKEYGIRSVPDINLTNLEENLDGMYEETKIKLKEEGLLK